MNFSKEVCKKFSKIGQTPQPPPSEWISQKAPILKNIRLQYLDSQILNEEIDGTNAVIQVKVLIGTIMGEQIQVEQYNYPIEETELLGLRDTVLSKGFLSKGELRFVAK